MSHLNLTPHHQYLGSLTDLSVLWVQGKAAATFLQGQLTCDVAALIPQQANLTAYCDYKGRVLANFWLWRQHEDDSYALLLPTTLLNVVQDQLTKYALFAKITISEDPGWITLLVCHPTSTNLALANKDDIIISQLAIPDSAYKLTWLLAKQSQLPVINSQLQQQSIAIDDNDCQMLQILAGFSFIQPATSLLFTPQMLNLEKLGAVSFRKGCYVGQEVIARTQHLGKLKRHLYRGLITSKHKPQTGAIVHNEKGDNMGQIINVCAYQQAYLTLIVLQDQALTQKTLFDNIIITDLKQVVS